MKIIRTEIGKKKFEDFADEHNLTLELIKYKERYPLYEAQLQTVEKKSKEGFLTLGTGNSEEEAIECLKENIEGQTLIIDDYIENKKDVICPFWIKITKEN